MIYNIPCSYISYKMQVTIQNKNGLSHENNFQMFQRKMVIKYLLHFFQISEIPIYYIGIRININISILYFQNDKTIYF